MSPYPIGYDADFTLERSRLTTFFRYVMALPLYLVMMVYAIAATFTIPIAWLVLLFTARYPGGLYNFHAGLLRYMTRVNAYTRLLTDVYPPFGTGEHPEYPVRVSIAPPKESYSRLKVFFRYLIGIPVMLISYALTLLANICAFLAWFVIVFTGKQSEGLQDAINLGTAYGARAGGYFIMLTEDWPPFSVKDETLGRPPAEVAQSA